MIENYTFEKGLSLVESVAAAYGWDYVFALAQILVSVEDIPKRKPVFCSASIALKVLRIGKSRLNVLVKAGRIKRYKRNCYDVRSILAYMQEKQRNALKKAYKLKQRICAVP